ncbi:Hypothetical protein P9515_12711 [Prochlorococcus marinus str. MIT 9515]|uniref:Uncharacterized protein n=1 Tax=Prochlorococcus marinus (strain MIT 9515) TaxID=167542 RepID=A2BXG7_PROM5|nr:cytochrome b6f subunit family protein [Prochlorococcus marinus]ABM72478.1 Hypothetical protein P9515_12711 [Prochlorococcus marinus str. MIT 9515]
MKIFERAKIGSTVQIKLDLAKNRLEKESLKAIEASSICKIIDFKITDGKGIGVILKLSNGKEEWFFEEEIDVLDENGEIIEYIEILEENNLLFEIFNFIKIVSWTLLALIIPTDYKQKHKIKDLINPLNFLSWLLNSFKDVL